MLCTFWPPAPGLAGCRLFSLPESRARLADLEGVSRQLQSKKVKVLAIPGDIDPVLKLNPAFKSLALVSDGSREAFDAYAGWDKMENLMREIDRLNQEKPAALAPDDHVH